MAIMFNSYSRDWSWLSNFAISPIKVKLGGPDGPPAIFPTAEHLYVFSKWDRRGVSHELALQLVTKLKSMEPAEAKKFGRTLLLRPNWETLKLKLMGQILREKYAQNTDLADRLVATDDALLWHLSPWDMYWGGTENRAGLNRLGMLTMAVRDKLPGQ